MNQVDVWRAAHQLLERHGDKAVDEALSRALLAKDCRDLFNEHLWQEIAVAIEQLRRTKPKRDEAVH